MKKYLLLLCAMLSLYAAAKPVCAADDSMAGFRAMIEYSQPPATDVGGMVAPEILGVTHYPVFPQAGKPVLVRARVGSYNSMVPYRVTKVELTVTTRSKDGEKTQTLPMKVEDAEQDLFSATLPELREGDEVTYTVRAEDDWGNAAVELAPDAPSQTIMKDTEDAVLKGGADILGLEAGYAQGILKMCLETREKAKSTIGKDPGVYGIFMYGNDVRFKPFLTETELTSGFVGAYFPYLNIKDLAPAAELFSLAGGGKAAAKRADFSSEGNKICFAFNPAVVRGDFVSGLKTAGATIAVNMSPMAAKPQDTTHIVMMYPTVHSFRVRKY